MEAWRAVGKFHVQEAEDWQAHFDALAKDKQDQFKGVLQPALDDVISQLKKAYAEDKPGWATRKTSGEVLKALTQKIPALIGGSADLTGSNLTKTDSTKPVSATDFSGSYIYYGIREHAMASIMNGLALYGGFVPYGGTFLVFSDYCRPSIRLAALMQQQAVYVFTHDSIGLGEDGPTHQPVEHLAALRAIPNLNVFRPADAIEVAECWQLALQDTNTPSVLALTRQGVPAFRELDSENKSARGAYILREAQGDLEVTIFASGSEVSIAMDAADQLQDKGVGVRVVSVPCFEKFKEQDADYRVQFMCNGSVKVAIEAAIKQGWEPFIGPHGIFVGMDGFGASAPAEDLYKHFGITAQNVVTKVTDKLNAKKEQG